MGTRHNTIVQDSEGQILVNLYGQYDGYTEGHGKDLAEWLEGAIIGNGIGSNVPPKFFNGVGDLALRLVTFFRGDHTEIGSWYLIPMGTDWGQEFTYTVTVIDQNQTAREKGPEGSVNLKVECYDKTLFNGSPEDFLVWLKSHEDEED